MTFEEFFKKKRINLALLEQAQPLLFAEFKTHYEQMGEKSFDHTKKYWFNKLRLRFPTPVEIKAEKVKIENPLAEQTITEMLVETGNTSKPAFKPRFKAPTPPVAPENIVRDDAPTPTATTEQTTPAETAAPKVGFKPRFKASPTTVSPDEISVLSTAPEKTLPAESSAPKVGFKPRFKPSKPPITLNADSSEQTAASSFSDDQATSPLEITPELKDGDPDKKPSYKPRFKIQVKPKPESEE